MSKNTILHLTSLLNILEKNKLIIATYWVKKKDVKSVLNLKSISIKKFRDNYAIAIIDYFIAVVKGKAKLGDCPVMSNFVNYLIKKGVNPKEVFIICMGLRKILVKFLLKDELVLRNPSIFIDELSMIFDANLSGVLEIFTNLYASSQKKLAIANLQKHRLQQTLTIIDFIDAKLMIVQNGRVILANKALLEIVGVKNVKELYLKYKTGFDFFNGIDQYSEKFKNDVVSWIEQIHTQEVTFRVNIYNEKEKQRYYFLGRITDMPAEHKQYIITLNDITDEVKQEELLKDSLLHDEFTGFRNFPTFENLLSDMVENSKKTNKRLFLAIVDIPEFRQIKEKSEQRADEIISEVAEDLRFLVDKNIYLSRLSVGRFGVLLDYPNEQSAYDWCVSLLKKMNEREERKTLAITEIDLTESVNKVFLRAYDLVEVCNNSEDIVVETDFKDIIKYKELPQQEEFTKRISLLKSLKISLYYMELAVSHDCEIIDVALEAVKLKVSYKQMKVSEIDMPVYFKLNLVGNIKCCIRNIDYDKKEFIIDRFRFDKHSPLDRKRYRISVTDKIKAYISYNNRDFDVDILDMNNECIAVKIDRKRNFDINTLVYIDMLLPISDVVESCSFNASIIRIDTLKDGYKMVLLCHFDTQNGELLNKYIAKCQIAIVKKFQQ